MSISGKTSTADHAASEALGLWEPKRTLTLEAARNHTRRVKFMRSALLGISTLLVAALVFNFASTETVDIIKDNPTESVKMVNPRYSGRTEDGLPFYLTAETATRTLANRDEVTLTKPILEFIREAGNESSFVAADDGVYNDMDKILRLETNVALETDDGYACKTSEAKIFAREKRIEGDVPIACNGGFGKINGNRFAVEDSYKTFIFDAGMTALVTPDTPIEESVTPKNQVNTFGFSGDGPINFAAQKATYRGGVTDLEQDVKVEQDGAKLDADKMTILREAKSDAGAGTLKLGPIQQIIAKGNFHYRSQGNDVRGQQGVYVANTSTITVTGNVKVAQANGNNVASERLIYNTKSNAIAFSGQCEGTQCGSGGRTQTVISGKRN